MPVEARSCDLADPAARGALVEELAARPVAVLCANAGFPTCGPLSENDPVREAAEVQVNVVSLHALVQALLPGMLARRRGRVLVTGSTAGCQPVPTAATYAATKAFANTFAESLHAELRGTGVSCTLLSPGPVRTNFYAAGGVPGLQERSFLAWLTPRRVAEAGLRGLERGHRLVVPVPVAKAQYLAGRRPHDHCSSALRAVFLPMLRGARSSTHRNQRNHRNHRTHRTTDYGSERDMDGRKHRWFIRGASLIPLAAVFGAMGLLWNQIFGWSDVVAPVIMYAISGFGISAGYHRMLTHRSFETYKPVRVALATAGVMAGQGPPLIWAAHHRKHHRVADKPGDPHSPHLDFEPGSRRPAQRSLARPPGLARRRQPLVGPQCATAPTSYARSPCAG
ncbi:hypothetical protein SALBM135S_08621 [Streptomyces alboniger]